LLDALWCYLKKYHNLTRQPLGGFRCTDCGAPFEDMGGGVYSDREGYVEPLRKRFERRGVRGSGVGESLTRESREGG
jgi:hypothetical protein